MLLEAGQLGSLGLWPFNSSPSEADRQRMAGDLTNIPIFQKQLRILRSKLDAARAAGAGGTPQYTEASFAVRDAEAKFDTMHTMALDAYARAQQQGAVRPLDENGNGGLSGFLLNLTFAVAVVVAGFLIAGPWGAVVAALVVAIAAAVQVVNQIGTASPAAAAAMNNIGSVAGSGAVIVLAVLGFLVFSKMRGRA